MKLRAYEKDWIQRIRKASGRVLIVGPTGSGKTVVAAHLIQGFIRDGKRVLFVAHRRELILQCLQRLQERGVKDVGVIMAGHEPHPEHPVQVASIQTLTRRNSAEFDVVFIDEAHRAPAASYRKVLDANQDALLYGLTATPRRLDGKPLDDLFDTIVQSAPVSKLIEQGYIAKPRIWSKRAPDLRDTKVKRGDYDRADLAKNVNRRELVGDIVDHWQRLAAGKSTVVYAVDVAHAEAIAARFRSRLKSKGAVAVLTGETPQEQRRQMLEDFEGGKVLVLVNVEVLVEGWDSRRASCCVLARPTLSETFLFQTSGRVMRPHGNHGGSPIILDHAGNFNKHGLYPFDDRVWSFEEVPKRKGEAPTKECPECGNTCPFGAQVCSNCGHRFWERKPPKEVAEYLVELRKSPMQRAVELYGELKSIVKTGEVMGVHPSTVYQWLHASGIKTKNHNFMDDALHERAVELYAELKSCAKVAEVLGDVTPSTVNKWLHAAGIEVKSHLYSDRTTRVRAVELYGELRSCSRVAETLGNVAPATVRNWLRAYGVEVRARKRRDNKLREQAVKLYAELRSIEKVGEALGVSSTTILRWLHAAGVEVKKKPRKDDALRRQAVELYTELRSCSRVAEALGNVAPATVRNWLRDAGVKPNDCRRKEKEDELRERAIKLYPELKSCKKVAEALGNMSPNTVHKWLRAAGIKLEDHRRKEDEIRKRAIKLYPKLKSTLKVGEVLGVNPATVGKWLRAAGVEMTNHNRKDDTLRERAVKMYLRINSSIRVAESLGVDASTVRNWLRDAGIEPSRKNNELRKQAIRLYPKLKSCAKVAEILGDVNPSTVHKWLRAAGIDTSQKRKASA